MIYDPNSTEVNSDADVLEHPANDTLEQMPLSLLPVPFRQMSEAISHSARVPQSLAGCCVLGALSASIGSGLKVRSGADRFSFANLFIMASAASGSGKSESFRLALGPFFKAEKEAIDDWKENTQSHVIADKMYVDARIDELKKKLKADLDPLDPNDIKRELEKLIKQSDELGYRLEQPCFSTEDATSEAIAKKLGNASGSLAILSADAGTVINNIFGRYNSTGRTDESIFLKAWSGDHCKVDRRHSSPIILEAPRMTSLLLVQPDKVDSLLSEKSFVEGGLIPRFLVAHTNAKPMPLPEVESAIPNTVKSAYCDAVNTLLRKFHNAGESFAVNPSKGAQNALREYYNHVVKRTNDGDLKDFLPFAARWAEQAWRIAVCIHAGEHLEKAEDNDISPETAISAIQLAEWFSHEQLAVLGGLRSQKLEERCHKLTKHLKSNGGSLSLRNLGNSHGFDRAEIHQLMARYPDRYEIEEKTNGGRPSDILILKAEK